ncbi:MAG: polymerase subunit alpha [Bacteroidales bacterium]|jgi:DNA polymerase-3 subunit alpha|nr:polymerase subunit alpha [Bacteroidales bacterium]MDN5330769.1 polymerase subunit alpha [Bacteroidales bacterium]
MINFEAGSIPPNALSKYFTMSNFVHLHVHSQYSLLDGAARIKDLVKKAATLGMPALALTDHGNLFGALEFYKTAKAENIKPIIGCEIYIAQKSRFDRDNRGHHLILLAKNKEGYSNLTTLNSIAFKEGTYYVPRIDKELLRKHSKGLICSSACLGGELARTILNHGLDKAEEVIREYQEIFGDDYYLELMRHGIPEQEEVNHALLLLSKRTGAKLIATNDVHYVNREDFEAHKILIKINTDPRNLESDTTLHYTGNEYLRSPEEMEELFSSYPGALENTLEIADKVEVYKLERDIVLPVFPLPEGFENENDYLEHLTYEGAQKKYGEITPEIKERLDYELGVIRQMGFSGYFLIVQDFINAARKLGVIVGPGRGSAAGSAVAYAIGITNVDPIKYKLLFERFLNPERVTMPDIDVDFDDEGREKVLEYVVNKYGADRVAQIVTFGSLAAKSAIRDVARALTLPLSEADRLAKMVPEKPGISLEQAFEEVPELKKELESSNEKIRNVLKYAQILEGSIKNTGTHACGVIIGPDDLKKFVPLATQKDSSMMITQFEGKLVESVGMLKMDFLGLKTLSIIREAIQNVKMSRGIAIDVESIPLDDPTTFELYQKGDTVATFQFESDGMRQYLRELKPTHIEDLIAMNALYRPGPMQFIPDYINRKHGKEKVDYPHEMLKDILAETHGIMVYQEQIMQVAQRMGGFSLGRADLLRRAMGKKDAAIMAQQKEIFIQGALENGVSKDVADEVFETMRKFAEYGFNRSHSAAYSIVAYYTGYLKANFPAEYMAAVLTHNLADIKKITFYIEECRRMGINVLGPDVNESQLNFFVNSKGEIRFGLSAIKNVGENAARAIIEERVSKGPYKSLADFFFRSNLKAVNKRALESLVMAGALDGFGESHRAQFFFKAREEDSTMLEKLMRSVTLHQERKKSAQQTLFDDIIEEMPLEINLPVCPQWSKMEVLKKEKEVTGFFISGHPMDSWRYEVETFCTHTLEDFKANFNSLIDKDVILAGIITEFKEKTSSNGKIFCNIILEDWNETLFFTLFQEDYLKYKHLIQREGFIILKGSVKKRYKSEETEFRVRHIMLLSDAFDKLVEEIIVRVNAAAINGDLTNFIGELMQRHKGEVPVIFRLEDSLNKLVVHLQSRNGGIIPSNFLKELRANPDVTITIKRKNSWH